MKNDEQVKPIDLDKFTGTISMFGYELIRDSLLPNILGKETHEILYWAGKELARQYPLADFDDLVLFFKKACLGDLILTKEKKHQKIYTLTGPTIEARLQHGNPNFSLEAGFLAEQMQMQQELYAEAISEINPRNKKINIILQWDSKDSVSIEEPLETYSLTDDYLTNEEIESDFKEETKLDLSTDTPVHSLDIDTVNETEIIPEENLVDFEERMDNVDEIIPIEDPLPMKEEEELDVAEEFKVSDIEEPSESDFDLENSEEPEEDVFISLVEEEKHIETPSNEPSPLPVTQEAVEEPVEEIIEEEVVEETPSFEHLTAEEALNEFDALTQVFNTINQEAVPKEEEESIFDSLPSRSSRHNKKKK